MRQSGVSKFWYDRLGRLAVSKNAKQDDTSLDEIRRYSYTLYDQLGRIAEVGELMKDQNDAELTQAISRDPVTLGAWLVTVDSRVWPKTQITRTVYDEPWTPFCDNNDPSHNILCQKNLRNRVSYTYLLHVESDEDPTYLWDAATFYSYDIHGNVDTLLQDYKTGMGAINCEEGEPSGNRWKKMVYKYDLISGKVNEVAYQAGKADQFYHKYEYDAENRLTNVKTSKDYIYWENDASYSYYKHGPLARTVLGELQVQGLDYAYTLQGWLKGVNSSYLFKGYYDMGSDGVSGSSNSLVARDAYSFSLNYFSNDYKQINTTTSSFAEVITSLPDPADHIHAGAGLYNGNIRAMVVNIPKLDEPVYPIMYAYRYDQLNRLTAMNTYRASSAGSNDNTLIEPDEALDEYNERIKYDANGNILGYFRNGATAVHGLAMDSLTYKYDYYTSSNVRKTYVPGGTVPSDAVRLTNRLNHVRDSISSGYTEDIDDQGVNNYTYDKIGNLTSDVKENISVIDWTVYGKISHIHKTDGTDIDYTYDAAGNRITKKVTVSSVSKTTYYVRDASGNVMSIYQSGETAINGGDLTQTEIHLYGSSRIGVYNVNTDVQCISTSEEITTFIRGNKFFELSNHLGNVLATVSDRKISTDVDNDGTIDYYIADVITANDYYPFGMGMVGRKFSASSGYRYGFNGKEKDKDIANDEYDFGARIYDGRIGRFVSTDSKMRKYPSLSPYNFSVDNPLYFIDPDGNDIIGLMKLIYLRNYPGNFDMLKTLSANKVWNQLTANFAKGGMYDKAKIDLSFSNYQNKEMKRTDLTSIQSKQGSFTPKSNEIPYGETGVYVVMKGGVAKDITQIKMEDVKNIERYVVGVKMDSRLYAEGAYGTLSHEVSTHVQTAAALVYQFVSGNKSLASLQQLQQALIKNAADEKTNSKTTPDHAPIGTNSGSFNALNTSYLNQIRTISSITTTLDKNGQMFELGGEYNKNNDASKPTINPKNFYNYLVGFLNGMIANYSNPATSQNVPTYKPSTQESVGGSPAKGTAPSAPVQTPNP